MCPESVEKLVSAAKPSEPTEAPAVGGVAGVRLNDQFEIRPHQRLPHLDVPGATAYGALDTISGNDRLFALVCDGKQFPRIEVMKKLLEVECDELLRLVDFGAAYWPADQASGLAPNRLMVIYDRPAGNALINDLSAVSPPMSEYDVLRHVLMPAVKGLTHLRKHNLTHRGIRPTNLFFSDGARQSIVFGDCVTTPPAYAQPALFESLESAMANPAGRGPGDRRDDIYSLGVTLLFLLLGRHPRPELDDEALLAARLANGSFATLVGRTPVPALLSEALRGMLSDDALRRWDDQDLENWLLDHKRRPQTSLLTQKSERPFQFEGQDYYNCRSLAHAITRHWRSTALADRKKELITWIERGVSDIARRDMVEHAYDMPSVGAGAGAPILNARLAMALDPAAPLRYKSFSTIIDGIGPILTSCVNDAGKTQELAELVRAELHIDWLNLQRVGGRDFGDMVSVYRRLGNYIKSPLPGLGVERCLYELNPGQHCLSPLIEHDYVVSADEILPALERNAPRDGSPFDRHIAAFIADSLEGDLSKSLDLASYRDPIRAASGLIVLYASLQRKFGPGSLPGLTRWLANCAQPIVASIHHRAFRKRVEAELPAVIKAGSLVALQNYLVHNDQWRVDASGFAAAANRFARAESEKEFLKSGGASDPARTRHYGQKFAVICSVVLATLIIVITTVVRM